MNRSPKELIDALAFAVENCAVHTLLLGDNELARLVEDWRTKSALITAIPIIDADLLDNAAEPTQKLIDLLSEHDELSQKHFNPITPHFSMFGWVREWWIGRKR